MESVINSIYLKEIVIKVRDVYSGEISEIKVDRISLTRLYGNKVNIAHKGKKRFVMLCEEEEVWEEIGT